MGEERKELIRLVSKFGTIGLEMGFSVVIGLLLGMYLDGLLNTKPWMTFIFFMFGIASAFKAVLRVLKESQKEEEN